MVRTTLAKESSLECSSNVSHLSKLSRRRIRLDVVRKKMSRPKTANRPRSTISTVRTFPFEQGERSGFYAAGVCWSAAKLRARMSAAEHIPTLGSCWLRATLFGATHSLPVQPHPLFGTADFRSFGQWDTHSHCTDTPANGPASYSGLGLDDVLRADRDILFQAIISYLKITMLTIYAHSLSPNITF